MKILIVTIAVIYFVQLFMGNATRKSRRTQRKTNEYIEKEREANFARPKEIKEERFIIIKEKDSLPRLDFLNRQEHQGLFYYKDEFEKACESKMIALPKDMSNREIKETFGGAKFDDIVMYEDNHRKLFHIGNNYAEALLKEDLYKEAEIVLDILLKYQSDISKTYVLYHELARETKDREKQEKLESIIKELDDSLQTRVKQLL